jgi:hypothetical protein
MATTKRGRRHAREQYPLTDVEELNLLLGGPSPFPTEQARREAWVKHREHLTALMGTRPHAQCTYEGGPTPEEERRERLEQWNEGEPNGKR